MINHSQVFHLKNLVESVVLISPYSVIYCLAYVERRNRPTKLCFEVRNEVPFTVDDLVVD